MNAVFDYITSVLERFEERVANIVSSFLVGVIFFWVRMAEKILQFICNIKVSKWINTFLLLGSRVLTGKGDIQICIGVHRETLWEETEIESNDVESGFLKYMYMCVYIYMSMCMYVYVFIYVYVHDIHRAYISQLYLQK